MDSETLNDLAEIPRQARSWDVNTWMLANLGDILQAIDWHLIAANSKRPPAPPKPLTRPETKKPTRAKKQAWPGKTIVDRGKTNG